MSRTHRTSPSNRCGLRKPKTTQEIRQNKGLIQDVKSGEFDYVISGLNRLHRHILHANDDVVASSVFQNDYK